MGERLSKLDQVKLGGSTHTHTAKGLKPYAPPKYEEWDKSVTAIVIGAGARGQGYAHYAIYYPDRFKIVGICEPRQFHRNKEKEKYNIPDEKAFADWRDAAALDKFADCVMICTPDRLHKDPAVAFASKGYHVLLEKPMAVTEEDCREIVSVCKKNDVKLAVCHILRYSPWAQKVKELIDSGAVGDVVNIRHTEPVGFWHFAHSYVRGNWRNEAESSFSLLAKCCHDVDLVSYWMGDRKCERVSSFGSLSHFRKEDKPIGAASRCLDCPADIENSCPYSAKKLYIGRIKQGSIGWPVCILTDEPNIESVTEALKTGPYGRCVYECDNDVMSHQVVNMQFEGGATVALQMVAFTKRLCAREIKIYGTKGEISVDNDWETEIKLHDFATDTTTRQLVHDSAPPGHLSAHGGADYHMIDSFVKCLASKEDGNIMTGADDTLRSHLVVFAAEKARKEDRVVKLNADGFYE